MTATTGGWVTFIAALAMMMALMAPEVSKLATWGAVFAPGFVALIMAHFSAVVLAFIGGKNIPTVRDPGTYTRATDVTKETV